MLGSPLTTKAYYGVLKGCSGTVCTKHLAFRGSCPPQPGVPAFPKPPAQSWRQPLGTVPCWDTAAVRHWMGSGGKQWLLMVS